MRIRYAAQPVVGTAVDRVAAVASRLIPPDSRLRPTLRAVRRHLPTPRPTEPLTRLLYEFANLHSQVLFMQIGANDGNKGDYLERYVQTRDWRGVLVEPVPYVFANLSRRHGSNSRLTLINAAIADHDGTASLYYLPEDDDSSLPSWYDAVATFRREVLLTHTPWIPDIDSRIATIEVPTLTFESLCRGQGIERVDLVQIDTEGYDYEVIRQIDLDKVRPAFILFEHYHLRSDERDACQSYLESHGYRSISNFMDTVAIRDDPNDKRSVRLGDLLTKLRDATPS
jgi:FkbM family methyltransferase